MATYVLVHGGGHGGWCYQRVARLLRAEGHVVYTPTLTGLGERSAPADRAEVDLHRHVEDVAAVLHFEDLRDVILVGHSYGGMVITGAADRAADRVGKLVYLDAATPRQRPVARRRGRPRHRRRPAHSARSSTAWSWSCCPRPMPACSTA